MRPHLPLKLRSALLAALVAVSFTVYSPAFAEEEEGDENTLTENKVYEHEETWTERITSSLTLDSYKEINISNMSAVSRGGAVYLSSSSVKVAITNSGNIFFENNTASSSSSYSSGWVIYNEGTLTFDSNADITFSGNSADSSGWAIYNSGTLSFTDNGNIIFTDNSAKYSGGAIYNSGTLGFDSNVDITFSGNTASSGGAIYNCGTLGFDSNGDITFSGNTASSYTPSSGGGAIYNDGTLGFDSNGDITFSGNTVYSGGAIYNCGTLGFDSNGDITFSGNTAYSSLSSYSASSNGGAIYNYSRLTFDSNADITFSGNSAASSYGGAIYNEGTLTFDSNADITFSGNSSSAASSYGGAIYNKDTLTFASNADITFSGNSSSSADSSSYGGAIYNKDTLTFASNADITFSGNSSSSADSSSYGGAIYNEGTLTFDSNADITFSGNSSSADSAGYAHARGGAIYNKDTLTFASNADITFSGNSSSADYAYARGGAIYNAGTLTFASNADITFSGNSVSGSASGYGGAIYNDTSRSQLSFYDNSSVLFEKNYEKRSSSYRLRSIYSSSGSLYLAAKEGGYITFKDSIYSSGECAFNAYLDENGGLITSFGEIVFSGESTEADLEEIMGSTPTASQITTSRTSELCKATTLYGGTLSIREQAILKGVGLTVQTSATEGGTRVSLNNGTLSMSGNSITFQRGAVLDVQGASSVSGNITMAANSTLRFTPSAADTPILTLTGTLVQEGNLLISIAGNATAGTYTLLSVSNAFDIGNWTEARVSVTGAEYSDLRWDTQGKNLYLDYKGASGLATDVVWNGGSGAWNSFAKNWQAGANASQFVNGMNVRFTDAGAGSVSITENLAPGSITVENSAGNDYTFFGTGRISGSASLTKQGQGTLTINNANSYTGDTRIDGGALVIGHAEALGHGVVTLIDGTLDIGGFRPHNDFVLNGGKVVLRETEGGLQIGKLTIVGNEVAIDYGDLSDHLTGESYTLATLESGSTGDGSKLTLVNSNLASGYSFEIKDDALVLNLEKRDATTLTWNARQSTWGQRAEGDLWQTPSGVNDGHFHNGDTVVIAVGDDITVAGTVNPAAVKVQAASGTVRLGGSGSITGNGTLYKSGNSTLVLDTANNYTGGTVMEAGVLQVGNAAALGSGRVTLTGGTLDMVGLAVGNTVQIGKDALATIANGGNYAGTARLSGGTLYLKGAFGGDLILNGGLLDLTGLDSMQLGAVMTSSLTQINVGDISGFGEGSHALLTIVDSSGINTSLLQIVGMDGITEWKKVLEIQDGNLVLVLSAITSPTDDIILGGGDKVLDDEVTPDHIEIGGDDDSTITGGGSIAGGGDLDKDGKGDLTIDTENPNWNGDININDGTVIAGNENALGTGDVNLNGGDLDLGGNSVGNGINVNTDATINGGENYQGGLTLNDGTLNGGTLNLGQDATVNNGTINNDLTGEGGINKETDGTVTLGGDNSFKGDVNVNDGTLIAGTNTALGTGDVNLNGGDLDLGGNSVGNDINVNTDATINGGENYQGGLTLNDGTVNGGTLNLGQDATVNNGTINNNLTGTGGINKETDGTVTLGGDNSFKGGVNVNGGTLIAGTDTALGTGDVHLNGGTLQLGGHGTSNDIFANGGTLAGAENNKGTLTVDGNVTLAGTTHADGLTMESGILTGGSIHDTDITANGGWILSDITGNGSLTNAGDTSLFGDNSYTGGTTINSGTLTAAGENSLGTGGVTLNGGTLHLGGNGIGNDITVQGDSTLNGAGAYTGTITLKDGTLTGNGINIASGKTFVLENGRIDNNLTGEGGVSKVTDGSVTLGGSNSYSGGTVVDAGTLIAGNDKAFGTGSVTVNGGVLDINGKGVGNNILLNDGATLRGASSAKDITVAAGASVDMAGHSVNAGQTLTTLGGNSIGGGITFNGGTIVMEAPNLTFTDVVSIAGGSVTTLDISAFASSLDTDGLNTLISFDGGLDNYTDGCLALAGVDNTLTQTLTVEDGKLMLALSTPATPPPAVTPAYNVEPSTLGGNRSTVYKQLVDGNRNAELDGVLDSLAQHVDNEQNKDRLAKALDGISGVLYTTQMSAQIDGNRAALGAVRGMMGYGQPLCSGPDDWRFAVQATSANSLMDSRGGAPGYTRRGFGAVVLAETRVDDGIVAGVSLGYEHADVTVDGLDKWKSDDVRFNAHLLVCGDGWQSRTILGIGRHDYDVTRRLGIGDATASSSPSGMSVNLMQEFSYMMELDEESTLEPFFRVESSYNTIDGISETGTAGNASLRIDKQEAWATTLILGARYTQIFTLDGLITPSRFTLEAGVTKSIGAEGDTLAVRFAGDPAHVYRLDHVDRDRWGVTLEGGVLIPIDDTQSVNASGAIQLRGHQTDYNASVGYSITF